MFHAVHFSARSWVLSPPSAPAREHLTPLTDFPVAADPSGAPELLAQQPVPGVPPPCPPQPQRPPRGQGSGAGRARAAPAQRRPRHRCCCCCCSQPHGTCSQAMNYTCHYWYLIIIAAAFKGIRITKLLSGPIFSLRDSFHVFLLILNFAQFSFTDSQIILTWKGHSK